MTDDMWTADQLHEVSYGTIVLTYRKFRIILLWPFLFKGDSFLNSVGYAKQKWISSYEFS